MHRAPAPEDIEEHDLWGAVEMNQLLAEQNAKGQKADNVEKAKKGQKLDAKAKVRCAEFSVQGGREAIQRSYEIIYLSLFIQLY